MEYFCNDCVDHIVYPILIKNRGSEYLTLYYYTDCSDAILHRDGKQILYFSSIRELNRFCKDNALIMEEDVSVYDFETPMDNPIDYRRALNNWNLLNTIAGICGMYFEGDRREYNVLYDLLFRLCMPEEPIPSTYRLKERDYRNILKVFRKKDRYLGLFALIE